MLVHLSLSAHKANPIQCAVWIDICFAFRSQIASTIIKWLHWYEPFRELEIGRNIFIEFVVHFLFGQTRCLFGLSSFLSSKCVRMFLSFLSHYNVFLDDFSSLSHSIQSYHISTLIKFNANTWYIEFNESIFMIRIYIWKMLTFVWGYYFMV